MMTRIRSNQSRLSFNPPVTDQLPTDNIHHFPWCTTIRTEATLMKSIYCSAPSLFLWKCIHNKSNLLLCFLKFILFGGKSRWSFSTKLPCVCTSTSRAAMLASCFLCSTLRFFISNSNLFICKPYKHYLRLQSHSWAHKNTCRNKEQTWLWQKKYASRRQHSQ